jgi:hypothetical protein
MGSLLASSFACVVLVPVHSSRATACRISGMVRRGRLVWWRGQSQGRPRPVETVVVPAGTWQPQARRRGRSVMRMSGCLVMG